MRNALMGNGGIVKADTTIRWKPAATLLRHEVEDRIVTPSFLRRRW